MHAFQHSTPCLSDSRRNMTDVAQAKTQQRRNACFLRQRGTRKPSLQVLRPVQTASLSTADVCALPSGLAYYAKMFQLWNFSSIAPYTIAHCLSTVWYKLESLARGGHGPLSGTLHIADSCSKSQRLLAIIIIVAFTWWCWRTAASAELCNFSSTEYCKHG